MDNGTAFFTTPPFSATARAIFDTTPQWFSFTVGLLIAYPLIINSLRHRRLRKLEKKFYFPTRESMAKMTDEEAFQIQKETAQLEFPFMFVKAGQFALFRVRKYISFINTPIYIFLILTSPRLTAFQQSPTFSQRQANFLNQKPPSSATQTQPRLSAKW